MNMDLFFKKGKNCKRGKCTQRAVLPFGDSCISGHLSGIFVLVSYLAFMINPAGYGKASGRNYDFKTTIISLCLTPVYIAMFALYAVFIRKRSLRGIGFAVKGIKIAKEYGLGLLIGLAMMFAVVFGEILIGGIKFTGISLSANAVPLIRQHTGGLSLMASVFSMTSP